MILLELVVDTIPEIIVGGEIYPEIIPEITGEIPPDIIPEIIAEITP